MGGWANGFIHLPLLTNFFFFSSHIPLSWLLSKQSSINQSSTNHPSTILTSSNHPSTILTSSNHPSTILTSSNHPSTILTSSNHPSTILTSSNHPSTILTSSNHPSTILTSSNHPSTILTSSNHPSTKSQPTILTNDTSTNIPFHHRLLTPPPKNIFQYLYPPSDECSNGNPCRNGGRCVNVVGRFECRCVAGYDGDVCQNNINECASNPCQSGSGWVVWLSGVAGWCG